MHWIAKWPLPICRAFFNRKIHALNAKQSNENVIVVGKCYHRMRWQMRLQNEKVESRCILSVSGIFLSLSRLSRIFIEVIFELSTACARSWIPRPHNVAFANWQNRSHERPFNKNSTKLIWSFAFCVHFLVFDDTHSQQLWSINDLKWLSIDIAHKHKHKLQHCCLPNEKKCLQSPSNH